MDLLFLNELIFLKFPLILNTANISKYNPHKPKLFRGPQLRLRVYRVL